MEPRQSIFEQSFAKLIGHEGGLSLNPQDRGNWTSGKVGVGDLKGTKFGVSAMSYPNLDIKNLTLDQARAIYKRDYWDKVRGDELPTPIAYVTFDAAVNAGVSRAIRWMQQALGVTADGVIGPITLKAARDAEIKSGAMGNFAIEFLTLRLFHHLGADWATFGRGWSRRLFRLPFEMLEASTWTR